MKDILILLTLVLLFPVGCWLTRNRERRKVERRSWSKQYRRGTIERRVSGDRRLPQVDIVI